jgi:hypothetical protein
MSDALTYRGKSREGKNLFEPKQRLMPPLPPFLREQLPTIEPSVIGRGNYFPCSVTLKDGTTHDCVYVVSQATYIRDWGFYPEGDRNISISDVTSLRESPFRLPAAFANRLYSAGESCMGGVIFTVVFSDGSKQAYVTGNAVDFISFPEGKRPADVVDVLPHVGRDANPQGRELPSAACLYCDDETARLLPTGLLEPVVIRRRRLGQRLAAYIRRVTSRPPRLDT